MRLMQDAYDLRVDLNATLIEKIDKVETLIDDALRADYGTNASVDAMLQKQTRSKIEEQIERVTWAWEEDSAASLENEQTTLTGMVDSALMTFGIDPHTLVSGVSAHSVNALGGGRAAVGAIRANMHDSLQKAFSNFPRLAVVSEWSLLLTPMLVLVFCFTWIRRGSVKDFSLRSELLLLGHLYWASYYISLATSSVMLPARPPLTAFSEYQPEQYAAFQVLVFLLFLIYVLFVAHNLYSARTRNATLQFVGATFILLHSYVFVTQPALEASQAPGVAEQHWFAAYAAMLVFMTDAVAVDRKNKDE